MNQTVVELFNLITKVVFSVGGDGEGWIVGNSYQRLADDFAQYAKTKCYFTNRMSGTDPILFNQGQEFIGFTSDIKNVSPYSDITIIVNWDLYL